MSIGEIGADAVEHENNAALVIGNMVFIAGMMTVAVTLGIVCDDISNYVSEVRHGNYQIVERNHLVILNVNRLLGAVLRQVCFYSIFVIWIPLDRCSIKGK